MKSILKHPTAWIPMVLSLAMIAYIFSLLALNGIPKPDPTADEGVGAHLFQLWLVLEFFIVIFFAVRWLPRTPRLAVMVLALQIFLVLVGCAPVFILKL